MPGPHPRDHQQDAGILEQQGDGDRQVVDGVEVTQLRATDGDEAVEDNAADRTGADAVRTQLQQRRHREHDGGDDDASGDRGTRRPAYRDQAGGERPGGAERRSGQERERQAGVAQRAVAHVVLSRSRNECEAAMLVTP